MEKKKPGPIRSSRPMLAIVRQKQRSLDDVPLFDSEPRALAETWQYRPDARVVKVQIVEVGGPEALK